MDECGYNHSSKPLLHSPPNSDINEKNFEQSSIIGLQAAQSYGVVTCCPGCDKKHHGLVPDFLGWYHHRHSVATWEASGEELRAFQRWPIESLHHLAAFRCVQQGEVTSWPFGSICLVYPSMVYPCRLQFPDSDVDLCICCRNQQGPSVFSHGSWCSNWMLLKTKSYLKPSGKAELLNPRLVFSGKWSWKKNFHNQEKRGCVQCNSENPKNKPSQKPP